MLIPKRLSEKASPPVWSPLGAMQMFSFACSLSFLLDPPVLAPLTECLVRVPWVGPLFRTCLLTEHRGVCGEVRFFSSQDCCFLRH